MNTGLETREQLFAVMEQIAEEREAARPIVRELAARTRSIEDIEIPEVWRTAGMVLELADRSFSQLEVDPLESLRFSQLAIVLASNSRYPQPVAAYMNAYSWKQVGYAQRYLDAYNESLMAFSKADSIFSTEPAVCHESAGVLFARACVLFLAQMDDEALRITKESRELLGGVGDVRRQVQCDVLIAMIEYRRGCFDSARERFEQAIEKLEGFNDSHTIGTIYNSLGRCYQALGKISDARAALHRARDIFTSLNMPSEVHRADWGLANILLEAGDPHKALSILKPIREDYLRRNMPEDAGEVGLCMVDGLIATGDVEGARHLIKAVLAEFINAKLNLLAIVAIAYLRELDKARDRSDSTAENQTAAAPGENDDKAAPLISSLLSMSRGDRVALVNADWRNPSIVRSLIALIVQKNFLEPKHAADLAALAVEIVESIDPERFPSDGVMKLRADAWHELGWALYYIGSFRESLKALSAAEDRLTSCEAAEIDLARVALIRACVYGETGRFEEGLVLSDSVADFANRVGNCALLNKALIMKGFVLITARRHVEALPIFTDLAKDIRDPHVHASALHNAGVCCRELLQLDQAKALLIKASEEYEGLGLSTPLAKTRWALGSVLVQEQRYREALDLFRQAREEFEGHGMAQDVALTSIDTSEVLLMLNRPAEVVKLCQSAMRYFAAADLAYTESAMTALAYLKEAAASRTLRQSQLKRVRDYLEVLPKQPELLFAYAPDPN